MQDKEELEWKQIHAETDKDGQKAAKLRTKLIGIMNRFDLLENFDDYHKDHQAQKYAKSKDDRYKNKALFKDKKLNALWDKAETAGFFPEELIALKKEFQHYQEKVDLYYNLVDNLDRTIKDKYESKLCPYLFVFIGFFFLSSTQIVKFIYIY